MKLRRLWISGFKSFGSDPTEIDLEDITFLIGPNGAGKTAILEALCRMFGYNPNDRRILSSDFHVEQNEESDSLFTERNFWIEVDFEFSELEDEDNDGYSIPPNFAHMRMLDRDSPPIVRFRLEANIDTNGEIDSVFNYVLEVDENDNPVKQAAVPKQDRAGIQIHYIPARREPSDHISYSANSLIGRLLRSANWNDAREKIADLTDQISTELESNPSISELSETLEAEWSKLHKGEHFSNAKITFGNNEIESVLRHLSVSFSPSHQQTPIDFARLSDGQKSLLYLSIVLAVHNIGQEALAEESDSFDIEKLRPPVFTMVAMEEPENSLSAHYIGRIVKSLSQFSEHEGAQTIIATHSPSILSRVDPKNIRYLRLNSSRQTQVKKIQMPENTDEAYKFVRQAVQSFPELYFSRLVVLGEGDSEQIVIPRLLESRDLEIDSKEISVVPLGGRHINHFWRLLHDLEIPYITLLDLDVARFSGGWGRIRYVCQQLLLYPPEKSTLVQEHIDNLPLWNGTNRILKTTKGSKLIKYLEKNGVFFSTPLDLDFSMMMAFDNYYDVDTNNDAPDESLIKAVLGRSHNQPEQYDDQEQMYFSDYHRIFQLGSKPTAHIKAFSEIGNDELQEDMPEVYSRLLDAIEAKLESLPE